MTRSSVELLLALLSACLLSLVAIAVIGVLGGVFVEAYVTGGEGFCAGVPR